MATQNADISDFLDTTEHQAPPEPRKRKRGAGDIVCMTLRFSRAQWLAAHNLALSEGTSINQLAIAGINKILEEKGLRPLGE
jgi:predicted HicB family RNase H-like nuclease